MCVQSRCRGVYPIWTKPESAPRPRTSGAGAVHKSGGSATLLYIHTVLVCIVNIFYRFNLIYQAQILAMTILQTIKSILYQSRSQAF